MKKIMTFFQTSSHKLGFFLLAGGAVLLPVVILPLTENFLLDSKIVLIFALGLLSFALWGVASFAKKSIQLTISPFMSSLVALAAVVVVSSFLNSTYPISQFLGWGGIYLSLISLVIFGSSLLAYKNSKVFLNILLIPSAILSVAAFGEVIGFGPSRVLSIALNTQLPTTPFFSLAGSPLLSAEFLFLVFFGIVSTFLTAKKKLTPFYIFAGIIVLAGFLLNMYSLYQVQKDGFPLLSYGDSWSIAVDGLKSVKPALIGFGPDNFNETFLKLKPATLNTSNVWNVSFSQASNLPFTLLSTLGLFGLGAWLLLVFQVVLGWRKRTTASTPAAAIFLAALLIEIVLPANILILTIQALALAFWIAAEKDRLNDIQLHAFTVQLVKSGDETQRVPKHTHFMVYLVSVVNVLIIVFFGYWIGRNTIAEYFAFRSVIASAHNNAVNAYNFQQQTIVFNPFSDSYRRNYSTTNLNIALALANSKDPSVDKNQILVLIQQSIRDAKTSTELDPNNPLNWLTLARVYANLVGVADQADQWTVAAYSQAMALTPNDPSIRLELGSVFYNTGHFDQAIEALTQATTLKPNWANAFYNLAHAYRQKNRLPEAISAYQETLVLVADNSEETATVKKELEETQALADKTKSGTTPSVKTEGDTSKTTKVATDSANLETAKPTSLKKAKDVLNNATLNQ
jgi:tetratricopeptide (TPR) repeat protein